MVVRGAPAIGATAAYGLALAAINGDDVKAAADRLRRTRPTGHDLFHAIDVVLRGIRAGSSPTDAAESYAKDDIARCRAIGRHGAKLIKNRARILTHCNAGALAAVDYGTVMAPLRVAKDAGRRFFVYVSETRPPFQGSRLTAWGLRPAGTLPPSQLGALGTTAARRRTSPTKARKKR